MKYLQLLLVVALLSLAPSLGASRTKSCEMPPGMFPCAVSVSGGAGHVYKLVCVDPKTGNVLQVLLPKKV